MSKIDVKKSENVVLEIFAVLFLYMSAIVGATHDFKLETWDVFRSTASNQNDVMLLKIVTLAGNVGGRLFAIREANQNALSIARVGLFRLLYHRLQHDALHLRLAVKQILLVCGLSLFAQLKCGPHVHFPQRDESLCHMLNGILSSISCLKTIIDKNLKKWMQEKKKCNILWQPKRFRFRCID